MTFAFLNFNADKNPLQFILLQRVDLVPCIDLAYRHRPPEGYLIPARNRA